MLQWYLTHDTMVKWWRNLFELDFNSQKEPHLWSIWEIWDWKGQYFYAASSKTGHSTWWFVDTIPHTHWPGRHRSPGQLGPINFTGKLFSRLTCTLATSSVSQSPEIAPALLLLTPCGCICPTIFTLVLSAWSVWGEWPSRWAYALIYFRFQLNMPFLRI